MKRKRAFKGDKRRATLKAAEQVRVSRREAGKLSKYAEKHGKGISRGEDPPQPSGP